MMDLLREFGGGVGKDNYCSCVTGALIGSVGSTLQHGSEQLGTTHHQSPVDFSDPVLKHLYSFSASTIQDKKLAEGRRASLKVVEALTTKYRHGTGISE